jgi:transcriptional regulator with XRE-family HTH domain
VTTQSARSAQSAQSAQSTQSTRLVARRVTQRERDQIDPGLWLRADMRAVLATRDIAGVFRLLQRVGVSQRRIAALTGQSQSEISEILAGRHVVSYDVLARIADGLGVPRGQLGLAYDDMTAQLVGEPAPEPEDEDSRRLIARLTELAVGAATVDPEAFARPVTSTWPDPPERVGLADVARLEDITAQLRAMDHEHGGGAARDAAVSQTIWAQQLLRAQVGEEAARALHLAVSELHLVAGWTWFDIGQIGPGRRHFARALEHARFVDEASLIAKALYCLARVDLHHRWAPHGVKVLQIAEVAAQQSGFGRAVALTQANLAWGYAMIGDVRRALDTIGRARDEYARSEHLEAPRWLAFFDSAELQALRGTTLAALTTITPRQRSEAIERFSLSTALRELPQARQRAFELTSLSWLLLDDGAVAQGIQVGHDAITVAASVRSQRVIDRLAPLQSRLMQRLADGDARDLAQRINDLAPIDRVPIAVPPAPLPLA